MATPAILSDVAALYKRLLNHRPVVQNEVQYFVKEFEVKRENSDLKMLQNAMMMANEIDAIFLEEISATAPYFRQMREKAEDVNRLCNDILSEEKDNLKLSESDQAQFDQQIEQHRNKLQQEQQEFDAKHSLEVAALREKIRALRDDRAKARSLTSSAGSSASVTIFSSSPSPPSGEHSNPELGGETTATQGEAGDGEGDEAIASSKSEKDTRVVAES